MPPADKKFLDRGVFVDPSNVPQGLKVNELTRDQKRGHLYDKGIRGPRAEEILDEMYGPEPVVEVSKFSVLMEPS